MSAFPTAAAVIFFALDLLEEPVAYRICFFSPYDPFLRDASVSPLENRAKMVVDTNFAMMGRLIIYLSFNVSVGSSV